MLIHPNMWLCLNISRCCHVYYHVTLVFLYLYQVDVKEPKPAVAADQAKDDSAPDDKKRKADAAREKDAGNAAYKKKKFDEAIEHYTKAIELWDQDISFLTNRAGEQSLWAFF